MTILMSDNALDVQDARRKHDIIDVRQCSRASQLLNIF